MQQLRPRSQSLVLAILALALVTLSCQRPRLASRTKGGEGKEHIAALQAQDRSLAAMSRDGLTGGKVVFDDRFEGKTLGQTWRPHPRVQVLEGWLRLQNVKNEPPVWLNMPLPNKVRVEFDARALTEDGDLKIEIFGDGVHHQSGYILVFGAHRNSEDWFARLDEHGKDRKDRPTIGVKKGQIYHMAVVRTDHVVRWFIDGEPFMFFDDKEPLRGKGHAFFAFNNWTSPVEFDNVQVFDLAAAAPKGTKKP